MGQRLLSTTVHVFMKVDRCILTSKVAQCNFILLYTVLAKIIEPLKKFMFMENFIFPEEVLSLLHIALCRFICVL